MITVEELPKGTPIILLEVTSEQAQRISETLQVELYTSKIINTQYVFIRV